MNKYKSLIISNIAETYYKTYQKSNPEEAGKRIEYDFLEAERGIFYTHKPKVVITSIPIDKQFLQDIQKILGYQIINLYPINPTEVISRDILQDQKLLAEVVKILKNNPGIDIIPYYATPEFFDLLTHFRQKHLKFNTPETVSPKNRFIRDHYNCKVGFRKLWEKTMDKHSFVKIPHGFIVDNLEEAIDAAWWYFQNKKNFVFKYNRGTSGFGIVFYKYQDLPKEEETFRVYLKEKHTDRIWFEEDFVVEEFIDIDKSIYGGSPSLEFRTNGKVTHLYNCLQRLSRNSYFEGVYISKEAEGKLKFDIERVINNCIDFGESLLDQGYKGLFDVDLVIDKKHNIYAVESNLRRTGGTHVHETAVHLFGRNYLNKTAVTSRDNLPISSNIKTYSDLRARIHKLYFDPQKMEGVIPIITSFISIGKIGYMIFGNNLERIKQIESELESLVRTKYR